MAFMADFLDGSCKLASRLDFAAGPATKPGARAMNAGRAATNAGAACQM
jgi:hypothetical protein